MKKLKTYSQLFEYIGNEKLVNYIIMKNFNHIKKISNNNLNYKKIHTSERSVNLCICVDETIEKKTDQILDKCIKFCLRIVH